MHLTWDVSLGSIGIIVTLIGIAVGVGRRVGGMETLLKGHASTLIEHTKRLDLYEGRLVDIVGNVSRLVGRVEATQDRLDRMTGHRRGEG